MARCELTGKGPVVKNLVSHSNIKTKFKAFPNVQKKKFYSQTLGEFVTLKVATSTIKSLEHFGGFDKFILNQNDKVLSPRAMTAKTRITRKLTSKKSTKTAAPKTEVKAAAPAKKTAAPKKAAKKA